ncbi:MAG: sigma-E factor regulatory protein RseB domain-containing protein, partial [Lysinibacillus sp.]
KEWVKDGKRRIEMQSENGEHFITVNDSKEIKMLDVKENHVIILPIPEETLEELGSQSPKDQAMMLLNMTKDSHDISIAGEEKIAGRDAYHVVAKAKKKDALLGDIEVWIDKKSWVTLKVVTANVGNVMTTEYQKIDFDTKIDDAQFVLDIPADATVEKLNEEDLGSAPSTIEEAKAKLGQFLIVPEQDGVKISAVEDMKMEETSEYAFDYVIDHVPAFSLTVFKPVSGQTEIEALPSESVIDVRGYKGTKMDEGDFRYIGWLEGDYQYGMIIENSELTFEEVLRYAEMMTTVQ